MTEKYDFETLGLLTARLRRLKMNILINSLDHETREFAVAEINDFIASIEKRMKNIGIEHRDSMQKINEYETVREAWDHFITMYYLSYGEAPVIISEMLKEPESEA